MNQIQFTASVSVQESEDEDDVQPFAALFKRLNPEGSGNDNTGGGRGQGGTPKPTPVQKPAPKPKPNVKPRAGRGGKREKTRDQDQQDHDETNETETRQDEDKKNAIPNPNNDDDEADAFSSSGKRQRLGNGDGPLGKPNRTNLESAFDEVANASVSDLSPEDREVMERFQASLSELKELMPTPMDDGKFLAWVKDRSGWFTRFSLHCTLSSSRKCYPGLIICELFYILCLMSYVIFYFIK